MKILTALTIASVFSASAPAPSVHLQRALNALQTASPTVKTPIALSYILFSA